MLYHVHNRLYSYSEYIKALNPRYAHNIARSQCNTNSILTVVPIKRVSKGEYHASR